MEPETIIIEGNQWCFSVCGNQGIIQEKDSCCRIASEDKQGKLPIRMESILHIPIPIYYSKTKKS